MGPAPECDTALEDNRISELPIRGTITFHHLVLIIVGVLTAITLCLSFWHMFMHATHYSKPAEQKHVMRILFILPVYAVASILITGFYTNYVYFTIISQLYEPIAVVSYLVLLCHLIAPSMEELEAWLHTVEAKPWIFPISLLAKCTGGQKGPFKAPRTAMTQFNIIWFCIYQYCAVRSICVVAALVTQATDKYCQTSLSPQYAHLWLAIIPAISIAVAMHCLVQAHVTVYKRLKHHGITMKLLCIKLVVFLVFWQSIIFSLATNKAANKVNPYIGKTDLQVILQHLVLSVELVIFAFLHRKAYPWSVYANDSSLGPYQGGVLGWRAFLDCINPTDIVLAIFRGFHWMFVGRKYRNEIAYTQQNYSLESQDKIVVQPKK